MSKEPTRTSTFAEFYRFAVLLTGQTTQAEQVMADIALLAETELPQLRSENSRRAWYFARIREGCGVGEAQTAAAPRLLREAGDDVPLELLEIEAYLVAQRFHQLPEPARSALALFYLDAFSTDEIAKLLRLTEDQLADLLADGRLQLHRLLRGPHA